jgi:AcrR family transcriptional regulator
MARKPADQTVSRADILLAAADVLQRRGFSATTMKEIAAAVNLTAASLYHHFPSKNELLLAVLELGLETTIARIEPIAAAPLPCRDKLRAMIITHIASVTEQPAVGAAMVFEIRALLQPALTRLPHADHRSDGDDYRARRERFFARRAYFERLFREVMADGIARGEFRPLDVPIAVRALLGAQNWVGVWYRPEGRLSGVQIADRIADSLLGGVLG